MTKTLSLGQKIAMHGRTTGHTQPLCVLGNRQLVLVEYSLDEHRGYKIAIHDGPDIIRNRCLGWVGNRPWSKEEFVCFPVRRCSRAHPGLHILLLGDRAELLTKEEYETRFYEAGWTIRFLSTRSGASCVAN